MNMESSSFGVLTRVYLRMVVFLESLLFLLL